MGWFTPTANNANSSGIVANVVNVDGFVLPFSLTFSHIVLNIETSDASGLYDAGIYSQAGELVANIGAQHLPSTGVQSFSTTQGSQTIQPGLYMFGWTTNTSTTAQLYYDSAFLSWIHNSDIASSSDGALPSSIGAQTVAPATVMWQFGLY